MVFSDGRQLVSQAAHAHVERVLVNILFAVPQPLYERPAAHRAAALHKRAEQKKFRAGKKHVAFRPGRRHAGQIQRYPATGYRAGGGSAEKPVDARKQYGRLEGLFYIVVRSESKSAQFALRIVHRRKEHYRASLPAADRRADIVTARAGQLDVQQREVVIPRLYSCRSRRKLPRTLLL